MKRITTVNKRFGRQSACSLALIFSVAALLFAAIPGVARADNIDVALMRKGREIMKYLQKNGYDNVGVLPFRVKKGTQKVEFAVGLINANMAERVENALVLATNPEEKTIGIIRDAATVARKSDPRANYRSPDARRRLFESKYPLAWNDRLRVTPDAFLCGKVTISPDYRQATVAIESFDKNKPGSFNKVLEFGVKTDRQILADVGQGFSLWKGKGKFRRDTLLDDDDIILIDDEGEDDSKNDDKKDSGDGDANTRTNDSDVSFRDPVTPDDTKDFPVKFTLLYDGVEQSLSKDPTAASAGGGTVNMIADDPEEGQKVTFGIRNTASDTVGLVLTVNGQNTLYGDKGEADQLTKWVLAPGVDYVIKGIYERDHKNYTPLVGLSDEDTKAMLETGDFRESAGLIHLYVFAKSVGGGDTQLVSSRSLRNVASHQIPTGKVRSVYDLQRRIAAMSNAKSTRGLIASANTTEQEEIETKELGDVTLTNTMILRYYTPKE